MSARHARKTKETKMATIYRQGDVLIIRDDAAQGGKRIPRDKARGIVLAYGEVTGHAHAISSMHAALMMSITPRDVDRILKVRRKVTLIHDEHASIELPAATYRVRIQREYTPEEIRKVVD